MGPLVTARSGIRPWKLDAGTFCRGCRLLPVQTSRQPTGSDIHFSQVQTWHEFFPLQRCNGNKYAGLLSIVPPKNCRSAWRISQAMTEAGLIRTVTSSHAAKTGPPSHPQVPPRSGICGESPHYFSAIVRRSRFQRFPLGWRQTMQLGRESRSLAKPSAGIAGCVLFGCAMTWQHKHGNRRTKTTRQPCE